MIYFNSDSTSNGISTIVATFDVGYSQDIGAVDIQNRVQTAEAVAAPRGQAVRRDDQEDVDRHGLRGQPGLARRPIRLDVPGQLRPDLRPRRAEADRRGERRDAVRAEVRHAGLARPGPDGRAAHLAGRGRSRRSRPRTARRRWARSAASRPRRAWSSSTRSSPRGGCPRSTSSRTSSSAAATTARSSGWATSPGSSSTRRTTIPPAGSAASRPARCRSTSTPTPTRSTSSSQVRESMDRLKQEFPPRARV